MPWGEQIHDEAEDHDGQDHEEEDTSPEGQDDKGNDDEHEGVEQSEDGEDDVVDEEKQKEKDAWAAKKAEDRCSRHTVRMNNKTRRARAQMARDFGN
jgi:cobalamin biosynthesis protein CobT